MVKGVLSVVKIVGVGFKLTKKRDDIKNEYCFKNNINLIRIKYDSNIEDVLGDYFFTTIKLTGFSQYIEK